MSRNTRQKEAILQVLRADTSHPTAQQIHEQVRQKLPHISLGTIYRDLKSMAAEGKILELAWMHESHFDWNNGHHYHFHCQGCRTILDIDEIPDNQIVQMAASKYNLEITHHRLDFYGLCPTCKKATQTKKGR